MRRQMTIRTWTTRGVFLIVSLLFSGIGIPLNSSAATSNIIHDGATEISPEKIQRLRDRNRSWITLTKNGNTVEVFLFAEDEKMEIVEGIYCGGNEGDKQYRGNYQLISVVNNLFVSSVINLGDYEFGEGRVYGGLQEFRAPGTNERLIAIYQYAGCNGDDVEFYRFDRNGRLNKVLFLNKNGTKETNQYRSGPLLMSDNEVTFCGYNNAIGHVFCDSYAYNGTDFIQAASWMTQELYRSPKTIDGEAKRVLFDFLIALHHGKYEAAVYHYGGSYDILNPQDQLSPEERAKQFKRLCEAIVGKCPMPEGLALKDSTSGEMKFAVSFVTKDWQTFRIAGNAEFEFRVKRLGNDFKVLNLPPYFPVAK